MNRITNLFETKKNGILSVYFTAGYPQLNDTVTILKELEAKGINMVEVGIPFSDPMADGPVIQAKRHVAPPPVRTVERHTKRGTNAFSSDGLPQSDYAIRLRRLL